MELQDDKMERKRFIIGYLSYYSFIGLVYYSLKILLLIDLGGKDRNYFGKWFMTEQKRSYCKEQLPQCRTLKSPFVYLIIILINYVTYAPINPFIQTLWSEVFYSRVL